MTATFIWACPFTDIVRDVTSEMDASALGSLSVQSFTDTLLQTGPPANRVRYYRIKVVP